MPLAPASLHLLLLPTVCRPPPFLLRTVCALQLRGTFEDLYAEAQRINAGRPTLPLGFGGAAEVGATAVSRSSSHSSDSGSGSSRSGSLGGGAMGQAEGPERSGLPACGEQEDRQGAGDASVDDPASVLDRLSGCSTSTSDEACAPTSPFAALCHSPFQWEQAGEAQLAGPGGSAGRHSGSTIPAGAQLAAGSTTGPASHPLSLSSLLSDASSLGHSDTPLHAGATRDSTVTDSHPPAALRRGAFAAWLAGWYTWLLERCESLAAASSEPHPGQLRSDSWAAATAAAMPVPGCL
jgi:hypothetical protein